MTITRFTLKLHIMFYNGKHKPHKCIIVRLRPEGSLQRGMWFGLYTKTVVAPLICFQLAPPMKVPRATSAPTECHINLQYLSTGENISRLPTSVPPCTHRKVSLGSQPLGEVVEGVRLGAHRVAVPVDLVEQVSRFVQAVVTDVHILLFYILRPSCKEETESCCLSVLHLCILYSP